MRCPFCKSALTRGEDREYETLCDHVEDPNREEYPLRETWVCGCALAEGAFWDEMGDYYSTLRGVPAVEAYLAKKRVYGDKLVGGDLHAIGSPCWRFARERHREKWLKNWVPPYAWFLEWRWKRLAKRMGWLTPTALTPPPHLIEQGDDDVQSR